MVSLTGYRSVRHNASAEAGKWSKVVRDAGVVMQ
jgi:hypothetical protein